MAAPAGVVAARVLSEERDDPRVGWLGRKWVEKAERSGLVPRKGSTDHKEEWAAKAISRFKSRI
jgi:hypothetical protein